MSTFPTARKSKPGYKTAEVDAFLDRARACYDGTDTAGATLTAEEIRHTAFSMHRGGYTTDLVDAALERLEDAFAARERESALTDAERQQLLDDARATAQVIINRLNRDEGQRFARTSFLSQGYNKADVDRFAKRLLRYFRDGKPMSIDEVRTAVFRPKRGGYREVQVDLLLDSVADVMLAVR
ncbi:MAG: DivIVA domain-containing protein [Microbacteriaceae bacterium]